MSSGTATIPITTMAPSAPVVIARGDTVREGIYMLSQQGHHDTGLHCILHVNVYAYYVKL